MNEIKTMDQCIEEAKKELNKRYITTEVAMLALTKWHEANRK